MREALSVGEALSDTVAFYNNLQIQQFDYIDYETLGGMNCQGLNIIVLTGLGSYCTGVDRNSGIGCTVECDGDTRILAA